MIRRPIASSRSFVAVAAGASALLVATLVVWSRIGGETVSVAVADVSAAISALVGAVLAGRAARRSTSDRGAWLLLAIALLLWGVGEAIWTFYEVVLGADVPFPSVADIAYLGAVPFAVAGVLAFTKGNGMRFKARTVLDACLVAASLLFVAWALALGPVWEAGAQDVWTHVITVAYPVTDLVLAVLALVVVQWGKTGARTQLRLLALGLIVMAVADTAFTWMISNETYTSNNPVTMLWPAGYLLIALASQVRSSAAGARGPSRVDSDSAMLLPYLPLVGALIVAAPRVLGGTSLGPFLTINGMVLVALVLVRQALIAWDLRTTVGALHSREAELARLAHEDSLTGLPNRASFTKRLEASVGNVSRPPAVVYIDLDGFKEVNDHFGHAIGDELLVEVGRRLLGCTTPSMCLARLGGDEFVVLVEDGLAPAVDLAQRVLDSFTMPFSSGGESISFQASVGVAVAPPGGSPEEAVRRADAAMYVAKSTGKGRAVGYPDEALVLPVPA